MKTNLFWVVVAWVTLALGFFGGRMSKPDAVCSPEKASGWKQGPPPADSFGWGAVAIIGEEADGFYFAEFENGEVFVAGVKNERGECGPDRFLHPHQVAYYQCSNEWPPCCKTTALKGKTKKQSP